MEVECKCPKCGEEFVEEVDSDMSFYHDLD